VKGGLLFGRWPHSPSNRFKWKTIPSTKFELIFPGLRPESHRRRAYGRGIAVLYFVTSLPHKTSLTSINILEFRAIPGHLVRS